MNVEILPVQIPLLLPAYHTENAIKKENPPIFGGFKIYFE